MSNAKIRKVVQGVHMGLGHDGLAKMLLAHKIDVHKLVDGDLILCLNRYGDKAKIIGGRGMVLGYLRMPDKQRIMLEALQYIPQTFGASGFNYLAASRLALETRFKSYPAKALPAPPKRG